MIIGGIIGHGNALVNPVLYGWHLFVKLSTVDDFTTPAGMEDMEQALKAEPEKALDA